MIEINSDKCIRCGRCMADCVVQLLQPNADGVPEPISVWKQYCLNCQHCLAVCPAGAVTLNGKTADDCAPKGPIPSQEQMLNLIRQRRSVRQWSSEPIDRQTLERLKESLDWAPTGCNVHNLRFTFIQGQPEMDVFRRQAYAWLRHPVVNRMLRLFFPQFRRYFDEVRDGQDVVFRNAPYMVLASVPRRAPCAAFDPVIALAQFDLTAQTLGIGTCWCGFGLGLMKLIPGMKRLLKLEKGYVPGALILFGKPGVVYERSAAPNPYAKEER